MRMLPPFWVGTSLKDSWISMVNMMVCYTVVFRLVMSLLHAVGDCFKRTKLRLAGPQAAQDWDACQIYVAGSTCVAISKRLIRFVITISGHPVHLPSRPVAITALGNSKEVKRHDAWQAPRDKVLCVAPQRPRKSMMPGGKQIGEMASENLTLPSAAPAVNIPHRVVVAARCSFSPRLRSQYTH